MGFVLGCNVFFLLVNLSKDSKLMINVDAEKAFEQNSTYIS